MFVRSHFLILNTFNLKEEDTAAALAKPPVLQYPTISDVPLNEFKTPWLAAMAFPTLFPYGYGDPLGIFENSSEKSFICKIRHLIKYAEEKRVNGKLSYVSRFASHPRFILWAHNIFYRHRTISQSNIYLQQNPGDANKTIDEIKEMIADKEIHNLTNNIRRYMANIPGSPSYWYNVLQELNAIVESKGPPHGFFTFSFADR